MVEVAGEGVGGAEGEDTQGGGGAGEALEHAVHGAVAATGDDEVRGGSGFAGERRGGAGLRRGEPDVHGEATCGKDLLELGAVVGLKGPAATGFRVSDQHGAAHANRLSQWARSGMEAPPFPVPK